MATQNFKRNLLLNLYREGKISLLCFLLPLKRDKNVWHLQAISSIWRPLGFLPVTLSVLVRITQDPGYEILSIYIILSISFKAQLREGVASPPSNQSCFHYCQKIVIKNPACGTESNYVTPHIFRDTNLRIVLIVKSRKQPKWITMEDWLSIFYLVWLIIFIP